MAGESLRVLSGPAAGQVLSLDAELILGRASVGAGALGGDSDISRRHARLFPYSMGTVAIEDLGSTNGTFVNGARLTTVQVLQPGDEVRVGQTALRFETAPAAAPAPVIPAAVAAPPPPAPAPAAPSGGRRTWLVFGLAALVLVIAGVVIAMIASSGGSKGASSSTATPTATLKAFYEKAAAGDSAGACALLAPNADQRNAPASLLVAGTGQIVATTDACQTTLDALHNAKPDELKTDLPNIKYTVASTTADRATVTIGRANTALEYKATLLKSGSEWRILEVTV